PPPLSQKRIRNVELCASISLRRICALPFVASRSKLLTPEEVKRGIKICLIDLVSTGSDLSAGRHFFEGARLRGIDPNDERRVRERDCETRDLNNSGLHC